MRARSRRRGQRVHQRVWHVAVALELRPAGVRPAIDGGGRAGVRLYAVRPGLTFHGLRHSHKTWLIAGGAPEIAQARRLGHHLPNRVVEVYSHVAPEVETRLLADLQRLWQRPPAARIRRDRGRSRQGKVGQGRHRRPNTAEQLRLPLSPLAGGTTSAVPLTSGATWSQRSGGLERGAPETPQEGHP